MRQTINTLLFLVVSAFSFAQNVPIYNQDSGPVQTYSVNSTEIVNNWPDLGGSVTYAYEYADNSTFTSGVVSGTTASPTYTISGLSPSTTKYFRVAAVTSGYSNSNWSHFTSATTLPSDPVGWYSIEGSVRDVDNDYTDMTTDAVDVLKNYSSTGAGPDFAVVSTKMSLLSTNNYSPYSIGSASGVIYDASSTLTLTGDFCVALAVIPASGSISALVSNRTDAQAYIQTSIFRTHVQTRVNNTNVDCLALTRLSTQRVNYIVVKRVGTAISASVDGGYNYGPTGTTSSGNFVINRLLANNAGGNSASGIKMIMFSDDVLTGDQLRPFFERERLPNYWKHPDVTASVTVSGSYSSLTNGSTSDAISINDNGSFGWRTVWSKDNYTFLKSTKINTNPTYSDQLLYVYDHNTNQISAPITLPHYINDDDTHNQSSLLVWDNTLWQIGPDQWYSTPTPPSINTQRVRRFGSNYNLTAYKEWYQGNGVPSYTLAEKGYHQATFIGSRVVTLTQEWGNAVSQASGLTIAWSDDNLNSWKMVKPVAHTTGVWPYPYILHTPNLNEFFFLIFEHPSATNKYSSISLLRTTDFYRFWNYDKTWSFDIDVVNPPTAATIATNAAVRNTTSDTQKNVPPGNFYIDTNGFFYGVHGNGENTAWEFSYSTSPGFGHVQVQTPAAQNVVLPPAGAGTNFNRASPAVFKDDTDATNQTYYIYMLCDPNSDGLYRVGKFTTTDRFATQITFNSYVSTDNTRKHWNIQPDFNYHYNSKAMIQGTSVNSAGTSAVPWFYTVK